MRVSQSCRETCQRHSISTENQNEIRALTIGGTWTQVLRFWISFDPEIFESQTEFRPPFRVRRVKWACYCPALRFPPLREVRLVLQQRWIDYLGYGRAELHP